MDDERLIQAVILAAGQGSRLMPLTANHPKPLLPINNKPVILQVINALKEAGIEVINIVVGYHGEEIKKFIKKKQLANISFSYQPQPIGSGDALLSARKFIKKDKPFLAVGADTVFKAKELKAMIDFFYKENPAALVAIKEIERQHLISHSCVHLNKDGSIKHLIEKPMPRQLPEHNYTALPIFIFSKTFWPYLNRLKPSENGIVELATAIQDCIDEGEIAHSFKLSYSQGLTYPDDLLKNNFKYLANLSTDGDGPDF